MPRLDQIRAYIEALDCLVGAPAKDPTALAEMAITLEPLLALGESLGPWPLQTPAGPLDALDDAL